MWVDGRNESIREIPSADQTSKHYARGGFSHDSDVTG